MQVKRAGKETMERIQGISGIGSQSAVSPADSVKQVYQTIRKLAPWRSRERNTIASMPKKVFQIADCDLRSIVATMGACLATDRIVVDGRKVGYCYREPPESEDDSGWRFFAGDEELAYLENADNMGLYEVNTIANYDEAIIGVLGYSIGCAFKRAPSGAFELVPLLGTDATGQT